MIINIPKVNSKVKHGIFGYGTIVEVNDGFTRVDFDDGSSRKFSSDMSSDMSFYSYFEEVESDEVRIVNVVVKKLFDRLDYDIDINTNSNVSILTAPNGCGKTTIFKFLNFLFNPHPNSLKDIKSIPFNSFACLLSNGNTLVLTRVDVDASKETQRKRPVQPSNADAIRVFGESYDFMITIHSENNKTFSTSILTLMAQARDSRTNSMYIIDEQDEVDETDYLAYKANLRILKACDLLKNILIGHNCRPLLYFIDANRLQKLYSARNNRPFRAHTILERQQSEPERVDYLGRASEEMATNINQWLNAYNRKLTDAKNKLPSLYLKAGEVHRDDFDTFSERWNNYHRELEKFHQIGLLESTDSVIESSELADAYASKAAFLTTYLDAFEGTLEPLQENYGQLKLLADIFDKRNKITHKTLKFTPSGITILSDDKEIKLDCLSSGEKNDFVMFYRLIFNTAKYGIVLIDEPEISLHIEWQEEYLDRLIDICEMNSLQAIVATHSPNIVNGHLDLFVNFR